MESQTNAMSRRIFLRKAGGVMLVASGTLAGDSHTSGPDNPLRSDRKIRIGVVGGRFGCSFQWHEHPNCIVYAVSDLRTDRRDRLMQVYIPILNENSARDSCSYWTFADIYVNARFRVDSRGSSLSASAPPQLQG